MSKVLIIKESVTEFPAFFRQHILNVLNVIIFRASYLSNISTCHLFFSHRTYFDNIVAIDSLLEHIMVSVISASMTSFKLSSWLHFLLLVLCVQLCVYYLYAFTNTYMLLIHTK